MLAGLLDRFRYYFPGWIEETREKINYMHSSMYIIGYVSVYALLYCMLIFHCWTFLLHISAYLAIFRCVHVFCSACFSFVFCSCAVFLRISCVVSCVSYYITKKQRSRLLKYKKTCTHLTWLSSGVYMSPYHVAIRSY
jgi:hypothetical protein